MTETTPDPATGDDDGLPDDVAADTTVPDDGTPQPNPDADVQDPDGTEADEAGA